MDFPTLEVVYERRGEGWTASSPQVSRLADRDASLEALESRVRARLGEWAGPNVQVNFTYRTRIE